MAHLLQSEFRPEPNEVVLFQARHSFKTVLHFLSPFLWLPLAGSMVAAFGPDVLEVHGYSFVSLAVLYLFWRATSHLYASVTITDRRVVARSGITNQDPVEMFHREIDPQSLEEVGRSAGAEIRDLFGNELPLKHIGNVIGSWWRAWVWSRLKQPRQSIILFMPLDKFKLYNIYICQK